ncbi:unnamed protein product [Didymodactylos carnosus]|uniref:Uncharacterized protein n=1 Tax=Didymodactylos carnosus TaxID=1234261 RepID=A0A814HUW9_9BILA|nr:unnamed protein product [Didymodactylos carnosus]CAF1014243.1 unnamed protein product [Didymodactylos carnosus]CAF3612933.1 unnamed protein product [Didymodactylos carnosus]CAF3785769.1 unnamed protein product [Didymodactylos carnosus]
MTTFANTYYTMSEVWRTFLILIAAIILAIVFLLIITLLSTFETTSNNSKQRVAILQQQKQPLLLIPIDDEKQNNNNYQNYCKIDRTKIIASCSDTNTGYYDSILASHDSAYYIAHETCFQSNVKNLLLLQNSKHVQCCTLENKVDHFI